MVNILDHIKSRKAADASNAADRRAVQAEKEAAVSSMAAAQNELSEFSALLSEAREKLVSPPAQGEAWDGEKIYIAGDTVEEGYVALKLNKGKNPADHVGEYWEADKDRVGKHRGRNRAL